MSCSDSSDDEENPGTMSMCSSPGGLIHRSPSSNTCYMGCGEGFGDGSVGEKMFQDTRDTNEEKNQTITNQPHGVTTAGAQIQITDAELLREGVHALGRPSEAPDTMISSPRHKKQRSSRGQPRRELCWLCTFCTHEKAIQLTRFVSEQAAHMSYLHIAEQVKDEIMDTYPLALGARKRDILRHIQHHMLEPNVRMSTIVRSLMGLAESVRVTMHQVDPETESVMVDNKQAELYLKIVSQLQNSYKIDSNRMLFSCMPQGAK